MSTIGIDAEVVIDGTGYFVRPRSYRMQQPRIRKTTVRADGGQAHVDLGPGRRAWSMIILCMNDQLKYDGTPTGLSGQQYRDALRASYTGSIGTSIQLTIPETKLNENSTEWRAGPLSRAEAPASAFDVSRAAKSFASDGSNASPSANASAPDSR